MDKQIVYRSPKQCIEGYVAYIVKYSDGSRSTVLEHREIMEQFLGRSLTATEIVHHIDEDKQNNERSNLEVQTRVKHGLHHHPEVRVQLTCLCCGKQFSRNASTEKWNRLRGKRGPFCGHVCAGRASHDHLPG